jgi:hypothetical protein
VVDVVSFLYNLINKISNIYSLSRLKKKNPTYQKIFFKIRALQFHLLRRNLFGQIQDFIDIFRQTRFVVQKKKQTLEYLKIQYFNITQSTKQDVALQQLH